MRLSVVFYIWFCLEYDINSCIIVDEEGKFFVTKKKCEGIPKLQYIWQQQGEM
jgi:hypothetical protein